MTVNNNFKLFNKLREEYKYLSYESYNIHQYNDKISFSFIFNLSGKTIFKPSYDLNFNTFINYDKLNNISLLENIIFNIGMAELISYWKSACPKQVIIKPINLNEEQINWWKNLYYNGLGEFFWLNGIEAEIDDFMTLYSEGTNILQADTTTNYTENTLIPIGGGKDSVVTLELLKKQKSIIPFAINPRTAIYESIKAAGLKYNQIFEINRHLDKQLIDLNSKGYLNGHTPFSSIVAFNTLLAAQLSNSKNIALSNESSANESTVPNSNINHQYSKSIMFEKDFRNYVYKNISKEINYFSFLRPLSELQIAKLFSEFEHHFYTFKSCNVGSKNDIWCCKCPKCLFTYIILSPFVEQNKLEKIFGRNLFDDNILKDELNKLAGITKIKPFECVGTIEEVNIALKSLLKKDIAKKSLLKYYNNLVLNNEYEELFNYNFKQLDKENFLPKDFKTILFNAIKNIC